MRFLIIVTREYQLALEKDLKKNARCVTFPGGGIVESLYACFARFFLITRTSAPFKFELAVAVSTRALAIRLPAAEISLRATRTFYAHQRTNVRHLQEFENLHVTSLGENTYKVFFISLQKNSVQRTFVSNKKCIVWNKFESFVE